MGFIEGFVNGFARAATRGRIERLCSELGWEIDERDGDRISLNFKCPVVGTRSVNIAGGDDPLVLFAVYSLTIFDSRRVPDKAMSFALWQSSESAMGKWQVTLADDDKLLFVLSYTALGAGLDAAALKYICSKMAGAASDFDAKMQREGYLR
jgi:hypothetical protein